MSTKAQVVVSVGPPTSDVGILADMIRGGMDVARINFSHGTHESNGAAIAAVRAAAAQCGRTIPIIQDLSGPRDVTESGHGFDHNATSISEKDRSDLLFGIAQQVSYIAQSFVGSADDVRALKALIASSGASIPVIAKIERAEAVQNIDAIIEAADAVMIARGDLGQSVPYEEIPFIEQAIISKCNMAGKPVIVATEMLYSMTERERPTRAEVTDVAFAILAGADAIMLSDETAHGSHPREAVAAMERIAQRAEAALMGRVQHPLA